MPRKIRHTGMIAIVDDNDIDQLVLSKFLKEKTADIEILSSGEEATALLSAALEGDRELPSHIFLDLHMPGLDGWDVLDHYQSVSNQLPSPVKFTILTSSTNYQDIQRSKAYPCVVQFLSKPITRQMMEGISVG